MCDANVKAHAAIPKYIRKNKERNSREMRNVSASAYVLEKDKLL
jgi:hypothetical protein